MSRLTASGWGRCGGIEQKTRKDSGTWTTVWWLQGLGGQCGQMGEGDSLRRINGNGKNIIKKLYLKNNNNNNNKSKTDRSCDPSCFPPLVAPRAFLQMKLGCAGRLHSAVQMASWPQSWPNPPSGGVSQCPWPWETHFSFSTLVWNDANQGDRS